LPLVASWHPDGERFGPDGQRTSYVVYGRAVTMTLEATAHAYAQRLLAQQLDRLCELRSRTGTLLAAATLAASFLGSQALHHDGAGLLNALGLTAFSLTLLASTWVLLPRRRLVFGLDGPAVYAALWDYRDDPREIDRRLAYWLHGFHDRNEPTIARLHVWFGVATAALLTGVLLWAVGLAVT